MTSEPNPTRGRNPARGETHTTMSPAESAEQAGPGSSRSTSNDAQSSRPRRRARPFRIAIALAAVLTIGCVGIAYFFWTTSPFVATDDAYVHGNEILLVPLVAGTVVAINADDTDLVRKEQPLVILDDSDARVSLQHAEAALGVAMRKARQLYVNVAQMKARVDLRKIELSRAKDDYRRRVVVENGSVSVEEITHARQGVDAARQAFNVAEQQLAAAQALVVDTDLQHHPLVLEAEARVLEADLALRRTVVRAPETGYVAPSNRPNRAAGHARCATADHHTAQTSLGGREFQGRAAERCADWPGGYLDLRFLWRVHQVRRSRCRPGSRHRRLVRLVTAAGSLGQLDQNPATRAGAYRFTDEPARRISPTPRADDAGSR